MSLYIQTNVASLTSQNNLTKSQNAMGVSVSRLSSGYRINTAADDAGALGISESMIAQIRSFSISERNANDGISMAQTADGAAGQMGDILARLRELAVQAANGALQTLDRSNLDTEFQAMLGEIDRISMVSEFNETPLLDGALNTVNFQVGINTSSSDVIGIVFGGVTLLGLGIAGSGVTTVSAATTSISAVDEAIQSLATRRASFGAAMNRFHSAVLGIQSMRTNLAAANSRIRDADIAEETAKLARQQILSQAGTSILAQANQIPQLALGLLKGG